MSAKSRTGSFESAAGDLAAIDDAEDEEAEEGVGRPRTVTQETLQKQESWLNRMLFGAAEAEEDDSLVLDKKAAEKKKESAPLFQVEVYFQAPDSIEFSPSGNEFSLRLDGTISEFVNMLKTMVGTLIAHWFTTGWERGEVVKVYNTGKNRFVVKYKWGDGSRLTHGCFEADYRKHWVMLMPRPGGGIDITGRLRARQTHAAHTHVEDMLVFSDRACTSGRGCAVAFADEPLCRCRCRCRYCRSDGWLFR